MYSKIDPTSFLKKSDHLNDSIDRSLVNEFTSKTGRDILFEFIKSAFLILAPFLSFFIIEITNILLFSYSSNISENQVSNRKYLREYIFIQCFFYFFGYIFFLGAMKYYESFINYDKREIKVKSIFYNFSRIFYFFSAIIYHIPLCFLSFYCFAYFLNNTEIGILEEFFSKYFYYIPIIFFLTILFQLNMQILKHFSSFFYLFLLNFIFYWINLYAISYKISNKISLISYSLISTNLLSLIVSHFEIKRNVFYLKDISFFYYEDILQLKTESYSTFVKYSSVKGILFMLNYPGVYLIIFSSKLINFDYMENFSLASTIALIFIGIPHTFLLSLSKYYKIYLENSVYDHSQNTKTKYLKYFWFTIIFFSLIFSLLILLLKEKFFHILLNTLNQNTDSEISQIFYIFDYVVKFYSIFIFFDTFGMSFQEIIKTFNDHSRKYLNFYKGISLILIFFPIGFLITKFLNWEFFWGFWIGLYCHMVVYSIILMIVTYKNYFTSTFQIFH